MMNHSVEIGFSFGLTSGIITTLGLMVGLNSGTHSKVWGFTLLGLFSFYIAKEQGVKPWKVVIEHLAIALAVIIITHYVGDWIAGTFC